MNYWGFYIFTKFRHSKNTCNSPLKNRQQVSSTGTNALFSRRFRRKTRLLQRLVFFRLFNAIGPLFVHYVHSPYVLSTSFSTHPKPLTKDKKPFQSRRVPLSTFFDTMRLSLFFRHCETVQIPNFFSEIFLLLQSVPLSIFATEWMFKKSQRVPLLHFSALCDLP